MSRDYDMTTRAGMFDADYDVLDLAPESADEKGKPPNWMLLDAVGGWSDGYQFFLKHRSPGEEHSKVSARTPFV